MSFNTLALDAMTDKGYGNSGNFQKQRSRNASYPYIKEPQGDFDIDDVDPEVKKRLKKKISNPTSKSDFFADLGTDKFYFVGGNTKLSDCFENPGFVLEKIVSYARMFNPVPALNKGAKATGGSSFPNGVGNFKRIGMKSGWASAPPEFDDSYLEKYEEDDDNLEIDSYVYKKDAENN